MPIENDHFTHSSPSAVPGTLLHSTERTRVSRLLLTDDGGGPTQVVRKQPLGAGAQSRLRHERAILERLAGVPGIVQLLTTQPYPDSLLLTDAGTAPLAASPVPLAPDALVRLALALARATAAMHRAGVVHRDLNPHNIMLTGSDAEPEPTLIDFALASSSSEIRPDFTHPNEIVGTMPYLAPEQTGRVGRPVDQRADLYSLGATLYQLATGAPPFGTGDPLRLSHDHLARVPPPPRERNPDLPPMLSRIIMHLLEKEPDSRYQTADGLLHDLSRLADGAAEFPVGERDHPLRLLPPSRLVGRDPEIAALGASFAGAVTGRPRMVLVSGPAGVGKTSLIDELRPIVTAANGWLVTGKFDRHRRDQEFDAVWQAFRQLGRLLLAEPDEELTELRGHLLSALGPNAGLIAALHPQFRTLLRVEPDPDTGDPGSSQARLQRTGVDVLRVIASPKRPVVLVADDLQWANRGPLSFLDAVMNDPNLEGVLVVGAYREDEVDATHPVSGLRSRWRRQKLAVEELRLANLPPSAVAELLADVLRVDHDRADALAALLTPHTGGNPYETVELLNSLRHEGLLVPGGYGWRWDPVTVLHRLEQAPVAQLLAARGDSLPAATRSLLQVMACLGGHVETGVLGVAAGLTSTAVAERLAPALSDGLLVNEPGSRDSVRFRHDRVQEDILAGQRPRRLRALRLRLARRLAERPGLFAVAADQYLSVTESVRDPQERHRVAGLLRRAADHARLRSDYTLVERYLAATIRLLDPADRRTAVEVLTGHHAALYSLGRLEETDEAYQRVVQRCVEPQERVEATVVQVNSLTNRNRPQEALRLGLELVRELGCTPPPEEFADEPFTAELTRGLDDLRAWVEQGDEATELDRPEITDPTLTATGALISSMMAPAYFQDHRLLAWLALAAWRIWAEHGPSPTLVGPVSNAPFVILGHRDDYRTGYQTARRILTVSQARGYEPATSHSRFLYALSGWCREPLEECVEQAQLAREGLISTGELQIACFTYHVTVYDLFDCAPTLTDYLREVEAALAFARRTGNDQAAEAYRLYERLTHTLLGRGEGLAGDGGSPDAHRHNPTAVESSHLVHGIAAALLGDAAALERHIRARAPDSIVGIGTYPTLVGRALRALSLADSVRSAPVADRPALLADLDEALAWLAARAADAPANARHLLRLAEAERAWAVGEYRAASYAFDAAIRDVLVQQRPWHRALILERAARFQLAHGIEHVGHGLLAQARRAYVDWGATVKVAQLDWAYPALREPDSAVAPPVTVPGPGRSVELDVGRLPDPAAHRSSIAPRTLDLLGVLAASQALSSETSVDGLRARVVEVLSAMTGATGVQLLLRSDDDEGWLLIGGGEDGGAAIGLAEAGQRRLLPVSAVRYVGRTGEPLVVSDATRDDRFARDPYLAGRQCSSLLAVPIRSRGEVQALLLLENRLIRGAFSADRLDGVMLIASQLAVSLRNAMVYSSLERKVSERTEELALANTRLERLSVTDALTGLANRRRLEAVLRGEWDRGRRTRTAVAMAMVDIDHFKLYNDHYGHARGDRCLQRVAALLRRHLREADLVARFGGEEFAVVMPGADIGAAVQAAQRLRTAVERLQEPHSLTDNRIVTVSIGVAALVPPRDGRVEQLVELADTELYRAKRAGRNRVRPDRPPRAPGPDPPAHPTAPEAASRAARPPHRGR